MLLLAALLHAVIIFGIRFDFPKSHQVRKSLEITLVQSRPLQFPAKADYLAPENQLGRGEVEPKTTPASIPQQDKGSASMPPPKPARHSDISSKTVVSQDRSEKRHAQEDTAVTTEPERPRLSADMLSQQIAEFSAAYTQSRQDLAQRPRMVYINSVNAHKYKAAEYERAWQEKVERIGNLNYPSDARRQNLSGTLLLSVGLKPDGSVYSIQVRRSSGSAILDEAAERIVRLAAPFAPFPVELRQEADVLVITRTWKFLTDNRVETSR